MNGVMNQIIPGIGECEFLSNFLLHILRLISHYGVTSTPLSAYFIGGWNGNSPNERIAEFKNATWSWYGNLNARRAHHQTLTYDGETMIFGGQTMGGA